MALSLHVDFQHANVNILLIAYSPRLQLMLHLVIVIMQFAMGTTVSIKAYLNVNFKSPS